MSDRYFAFVSYASNDRAAAEDLVKALEQKGLACWMAPRNIDAGADYGEQILQGIRDSSTLALVFSKNSNASKFCQREIERGVHYGRRIVPIRIDDSVPSGGMEFHLSVVQWMNMHGDNDWDGVASRLRQVIERLNSQPPSGVSMPTNRGSKPYRFKEGEYRTAEELAIALSEDWDAGVKNFGRGFVSEWVQRQLENQDLAARLLDVQEDKELSPDEKLSQALVEMDRSLPAMWRGNVVNREWAAREPESFQALLQSRVRPKLERQPGWPVELIKKLTELKSAKLPPEHLSALERVAITGNPQLKIGDWEVTPETLSEHPARAVTVLESQFPALYQQLTEQAWLLEAAQDWLKYWPEVKALGCGTHAEKALPWIIGSADALQERAGAIATQYVGSTHEALNRLWSAEGWGTAECAVLCAAAESQMLTVEAKHEMESLAYLKSFDLEMDWELAKELIKANSWEVLKEPWQKALSSSAASQLKLHPRLKQALKEEQPEYLDIVALCAGSKKQKEPDAQERNMIWANVLATSPSKSGKRTMSQLESFLERALEIDRQTIKLFFSGLESRIVDTVTRGRIIIIPNWGSFGIAMMNKKARTCRNPATGGKIKIPAKTVAKGRFSLSHTKRNDSSVTSFRPPVIVRDNYGWCSYVSVKTDLLKLTLRRRLAVEICRATDIDLPLVARLMDEFLSHLSDVIAINKVFCWKRVGNFGRKGKANKLSWSISTQMREQAEGLHKKLK